MENKEKKDEQIKDELRDDLNTEQDSTEGGNANNEKEDSVEENEEGAISEEDNRIQDLNNKLLRLQADFINYKNRVERDKKNIYAYAAEEIISQILPVLDNFERALGSMEKDNSYYQGVKMIYDQLIDVLKNNGLKEIECEGEQFDPNLHHAVFMEEAEGKEEGTVLEVLQKGYVLNDKVIRPSMVKVAK